MGRNLRIRLMMRFAFVMTLLVGLQAAAGAQATGQISGAVRLRRWSGSRGPTTAGCEAARSGCVDEDMPVPSVHGPTVEFNPFA